MVVKFVTENCICIVNENDARIRSEILNRLYEIEGYKDLPRKEKNELYDKLMEEYEQ